MPEPTTTTDYNQAIQHCAEAYYRVRAELPKDAGYHDNLHNQQRAGLAYLTELPILSDPAAFQLYIACIAKGVAIGAVDIVDAGRLCHIAQTAMSAWKLANLIVPAAQARQRAAEQKEPTPPPKGNHFESQDRQSQPKQPPQDPKQTTPLPSKGNHSEGETLPYDDWQSLYAATKLPDWETQVELFKSLRDRGEDMPSDEELRGSPADALRYCETARYFKQNAPPSPSLPKEQPPAGQQQPAQVA